MKKISVVFLLFFVMLIPAFSSETETETAELNPKGWWAALWEGVYPTYDLYGRSVLFTDSLNVGGGFTIGAETSMFRFEFYAQGDYFMAPLDSQGSLALLEFDVEAGLSLGWKFLKFWSFDVYVACDIGYFMQVLITPYQSDSYTLGFNGLMVRPKLMTELNIGKWYGISVGVFYQFPVYPSYERYRGIGIMVSIL